MCGRFTLHHSIHEISKFYKINEISDFSSSYNIAPTQPVIGIHFDDKVQEKILNKYQWGLIPSWSKDDSYSSKMINARAETIQEKPSFKNIFKKKRCLIVADGFYEWSKITNGKNVIKQPYYFQFNKGELFTFAGLYDEWERDTGYIRSCTIITTEANDLMKEIHDRMPVIIDKNYGDFWIDHSNKSIDDLKDLLKPRDYPGLQKFPVSTKVNSPKNNSVECTEKLF